jgi:hypothetical protein
MNTRINHLQRNSASTREVDMLTISKLTSPATADEARANAETVAAEKARIEAELGNRDAQRDALLIADDPTMLNAHDDETAELRFYADKLAAAARVLAAKVDELAAAEALSAAKKTVAAARAALKVRLEARKAYRDHAMAIKRFLDDDEEAYKVIEHGIETAEQFGIDAGDLCLPHLHPSQNAPAVVEVDREFTGTATNAAIRRNADGWNIPVPERDDPDNWDIRERTIKPAVKAPWFKWEKIRLPDLDGSALVNQR